MQRRCSSKRLPKIDASLADIWETRQQFRGRELCRTCRRRTAYWSRRKPRLANSILPSRQAHEVGIWSLRSNREKAAEMLRLIDAYDKFLEYKFTEQFHPAAEAR
jgi:hypothetical protein